MENEMKKLCKDCGRAISPDEYEAFNGRCVGCDEIHSDNDKIFVDYEINEE